MKKKAHLVFIPSPGMGHLVPTVELAKLMIDHDNRLSITFFVIVPPFDSKVTPYLESLTSFESSRLQFIKLLCKSNYPEDRKRFYTYFIESQKPHVKQTVANLINTQNSPDSPRLAGFVIDMFCTPMIEVANEFEVPTYLYLTSSASFLGLNFHLKTLHEDQNVNLTLFEGSEVELEMPVLVNPLPAKLIPTVFMKPDWFPGVLATVSKFTETKGIIINTFMELEPRAVKALGSSHVPPVYPVGPILNIKSDSTEKPNNSMVKSDIMKWLDEQPPLSVVFLCFGSMGSFGVDQLKEIASALESSGHRFVWSLRKSPPMDAGFAAPTEYTNPEEVLPGGFVGRTAKVGRIIGWAPQAAILSHPSVGGFVSHCGWNSILESLWFGVPIAAWPMQAEQQFNAFHLVVELGIAVEIKMNYRRSFIDNNEIIVSANEIEMGIRGVMEQASEMRVKVKKISEASRLTLMEGGSSYSFLDSFICDVVDNL